MQRVDISQLSLVSVEYKLRLFMFAHLQTLLSRLIKYFGLLMRLASTGRIGKAIRSAKLVAVLASTCNLHHLLPRKVHTIHQYTISCLPVNAWSMGFELDMFDAV